MWTFLYVFFLILLTISLKQESLSVDLHYYSIVLNSLVSTLHSISVKHTRCHIIFWSSMIHVYFYQTQDMVPLTFIQGDYQKTLFSVFLNCAITKRFYEKLYTPLERALKMLSSNTGSNYGYTLVCEEIHDFKWKIGLVRQLISP